MAYTYLTSGHRADALGNNGGTTGTVDSTGANLLVLAVATDNPVTLVAGDISDSKSNASWVLAGNATYGATARLHIFYHLAPSVGSGHTFTVTKTSSFCSAAVACFSGAHASPFDQESGDTGTAAIKPASSLTPSADNCLVVTALSLTLASTITEPSGYAKTDEVGYGSTYGVSMAYAIQTTATATQPEWTSTAGFGMGVQAVVFKAATGGGGGGVPVGSSLM
jgi:hypothetical protein